MSAEEAMLVATDIRKNASMGTCYTILVKERVVAIAGVALIRKGIGELWSVSTPEIKRNPKFYYKVALWGINDGFKQFNLRRLQTICRYDDATAYNWQKRLGFEFEGVMKAHNDDGSDAVRMGMVCGQQKIQDHY
jgi:hypothetical protein